MITNDEHTEDIRTAQNIIQNSKETDWDVLASKNLNFFVNLNNEHIPVENRKSRNDSPSDEMTTDFNYSNKEQFLADYQTGIFD
jgi:hypothetical protein